MPTAIAGIVCLVDDQIGANSAQFVGSIAGTAPVTFTSTRCCSYCAERDGCGRRREPPHWTRLVRVSTERPVHCVENTGGSELRLWAVFIGWKSGCSVRQLEQDFQDSNRGFSKGDPCH